MKLKVLFIFSLVQCLVCTEVYDCFTFFNELELLKLRLEELYESVDYFVIVESPLSFTLKPKPLHFEENFHKFEKYKDKIIHIVINSFPDLTGDDEKDHWIREEYSRNAILYEGLINCKDDDVIFISDLDEIPNARVIPKIVQHLRKYETLPEEHRSRIADSKFVCDLHMRLFMYQMNRENFMGWWGGSKAAPYWIVKKYKPWGIKLFHHTNSPCKILNAGWHFNTMGGKERALEKWINTGPLYHNEELLNELGKDENKLENSYREQVQSNTVPVPIDDSYPKYFLDNLAYFRSLGWIDE
jgi:beta-1,4-mannosyl-glycoprotein beta-1,4-N-acetylglucosaminyltransferase